MMPTYFSPQAPGSVPPSPLCPLTTAIAPSKRRVEDDDDIQFISEKPVKRRRISEKQPAVPMPQQPMNLLATDAGVAAAASAANIVPNISTTATQMPSSDPRDTERRLSTGMVGLPSDIQAIELTYALRGVSMPVLENFVLDQPFRKPRPSSPPELSPKQLPSTVSPEMLNIQSGQCAPGAFGVVKPSNDQIVCQSSRHTTSCQIEKPPMTSQLAKTTLDTHQTPVLMAPSSSNNRDTPTFSDRGKRADSKSTPMPPPPSPLTVPHPEVSHGAPSGSSPRLLNNHHHHNSSAHSQKHPCQVCSRLRYQAQLSRAQGLPMVNAALPPHLMPQLHYHTSYGQHIHPQMLTIPTSNVHQYGTNFAPVMIPVNGNSFVPLSSRPPPQPSPQQSTPQQQEGAETDKQTTSEQSRKTESPQISQLKNTASNTSATSSPIKPPASLIQPTYRKPSPNLIVDVAETCQEKFPFEEVAKRHNVPVDKVFDVFAAIIQVPLLRCPTDRRRPGRLATARIKEYNKAKKDILDFRTDKGEVNGPEAAVDSTDIAQKLGRVEFPDGFNLRGKS
ncbi:hypothetical protein F4801DRAFT_526100 [Xylaria longipes]|nr:hypothetical protein F4801DRAFT_526100 [Xylaria longipes]RYC64570.1 hypothetical protein CHU98_g1634 [Xylaria longipes]